MALKSNRDMTLEEFDRWLKAQREIDQVKEATLEEGGPRVSLVPAPTSVPRECMPDEITLPATTPPPGVVPFKPEPSRNALGWSAERQRIFIEALAETGSVHSSARSAGLSARSAYALRVRSRAFAQAWDAAQQLAVGRLSALAFDRAINGRIEQVYHQGELVGERQIPSEKLLMWLLSRLDPKRFALPWERDKNSTADPQAEAQVAFPALLDGLSDLAEGDFAMPPSP